MKKDLLTILDLERSEILSLIERGLELKKLGRKVPRILTGYTLGLLFEKASTRTRVSFETAMFRMGGQCVFLNKTDTQLSRDESVADTARVLSRYLDVIAIRTYSQALVEEMAKWASIPVINALTDLYHPCQILSDLMTIQEKRGSLEDMKVAWVGDGNNMAHSWINAATVLGFELVLACPPGYEPLSDVMGNGKPNIRLVGDPKVAATGADVLNTDVWASMGQEKEKEKRRKDFRGYQVNQELLERGKPDILVLHCLPAHRGEEITGEVLDGPHSIVFDEAENKMHLHQALLERLLIGR
ncbi:MAG: ornithine carbamoyltransferase [Desulfobacteraceae bacterium]|nr:MAG: ornithine carbamoyltransferase [Desulfobacteraceae bacterium]